MSPSAGAAAIVGPGGALDAHKALHGEANTILSERGVTNPGGTTALSGGAGGARPVADYRSVAKTPEELAVLNQIDDSFQQRLAGQHMTNNALPGSPYYFKGYEMQTQANKELAELAKTQAGTELVRRQTAMQGWMRGQYGWTNLINGQQIPYSQFPGFRTNPTPPSAQRAEQPAHEQPTGPQQQTPPTLPPTTQPSIGGAGVPTYAGPQQAAPPQGQMMFPPGAFGAPPGAQTPANRPLPASEEEKKASSKAGQQAPYAQTDVLQHPALNTRVDQSNIPPPGSPGTQDRMINTLGDEGMKEANKMYQTEYADAYKAAGQAEKKLGAILDLQETLGRLKSNDVGWGAESRAKFAHAVNSTMKFLYGLQGRENEAPVIKEQEVSSFDLAEKQVARIAFDSISNTMGGAGRSRFAAKFLQEANPDLNSAPDAIYRSISYLKQMQYHDIDYAKGMQNYYQAHGTTSGYLDFFDRFDPIDLYMLKGRLEAKGATGNDINWFLQNPQKRAKVFDEDFGYGSSQILMESLNARRH
jgi:hypothetical protein